VFQYINRVFYLRIWTKCGKLVNGLSTFVENFGLKSIHNLLIMSDEIAVEETFDSADSGASKTFPKQCSALRKSEHVIIKGRPCKIVEMSTSKTGKHGHAKVHMVAIDIFTGKKYEDICPSTHNMDVPFIKRKDYQIMSINDDGYVSLLDMDSCDEKNDLKLPEGEMGAQIRDAFEKDESGILVSVTSAIGEEMILSFKNMPKD